jgi:peptidoglycan/LPS O-acetylase OafA/YrhL
MMTEAPFLKTAKPVMLVSILLFAIHAVLVFAVLPPLYAQSYFWLIHLFLIPMTLGALFFIVRANEKNPKSVGKSFFIYIVIKMVLIFAFLSPWLITKNDFSRPMVYQFFAVFFPLLFMETFVLIKLVNAQK